MPTLTELKSKWFIPMDGSAPNGVPCRRHTKGTGPDALSVSTDGNTVKFLIDGQKYMARWHDELLNLHSSQEAEFFHAAWRFEDVKPLGAQDLGNDALKNVEEAKKAGVKVYALLCRNLVVILFNYPSLLWLYANDVWRACLDYRFPPTGSNHQKFTVFKGSASAVAMLGSIDISKTRWDTSDHLPQDDNRDPELGKQTHDAGVAIDGPAVADIENTFRERWNDSTRTFGMQPLEVPQPLIKSPIASPPASGTHSIQVLRTYAITSTVFGYSWSPRGEFTVWASYINAIKQAKRYVYIEDQYFLPFDWPPCHTRNGSARDTDIFYQLGEAVKRSVRVIVVTPSNAEDGAYKFQKYQRDVGINYLIGVQAAAATGDVVVASLKNGTTDVYVHSKLMIVDDEFVAIGSANVGQRSMSFDSELQVGIVDSVNEFAREFRKALWSEHTGHLPMSLDDPVAASETFKNVVNGVTPGGGRLKPYAVDPHATFPPIAGLSEPPIGHKRAINFLVDPYAGPPELRQ